MTTIRRLLTQTLFIAVIAGSSLGSDKHEHSRFATSVGSVHFPISCLKQAQEHVEYGLAMFHSFLFDDAENEFKLASGADPVCAMAYWAEAMGLYRPLAYLPSDSDMKKGWDLVQTALRLGAKTERERDYLAAAAILYRPDTRNYETRNHEYSAEMQKLSSINPDDTEAVVFCALSILTFADSPHHIQDSERAIAILNPLLAKYPDHPGLAHYVIHAADNPQLAQEGLAAARLYAEIAPAAPHAVHMPSHIFARLGLWQEDIQSNIQSLHAAQSPSVVHVGAENQLHAMEFLEYAYLQIGDEASAKEIVEAQRRISYDQVDPNLHDYVNRTFANSPALYAIETKDWKAAELLKPDAEAEPYNQAIVYWAHAIAAGHLHDLPTVRNAVERYQAMVEATKKGPKPYVAKYMTTSHDEANAWLFFLQGHHREATELMRTVADQQDANGKGEIEIPAREMLADMLMERDQPADALVEYEKSMRIDPNRFNGLYGAGHAAELLGEHNKERRYYMRLLENCAGSLTRRPELEMAKRSLPLDSSK